MNDSDVYFTSMRTRPRKSIIHKLADLLTAAGFGGLDLEKKYVALKLHLGEPGNLAYLRPNYVAQVVDMVRAGGGRPFVTDTNSLYTGHRSNAVDHLEAAGRNGFNRITLGCDVIIADGLKGTDYREVEIGAKHVKAAKVASAIADSDTLVSVSHFKGHEMTGFGGAIKNLGMGCGSRGGKLEMHSASKPKMDKEKCTSCAVCLKSCSQKAIAFDSEKKAEIDYEKCVGCGQCVAICEYGAAGVVYDESAQNATEKIAEYALAALKDKQSFHVGFIVDVSPYCDCWGHNDAAIVPDIGIAASLDPVALDRACVDMVNEAPVNAASVLGDSGLKSGGDKFGRIHPNTSWQNGLAYAQSIGLGTQDYTLKVIE